MFELINSFDDKVQLDTIITPIITKILKKNLYLLCTIHKRHVKIKHTPFFFSACTVQVLPCLIFSASEAVIKI